MLFLPRVQVSRLFGQAKQVSDDALTTNIEANYKKMYQIYDQKSADINTYRKMLIFRSKNLGMKELDLLIGTWAQRHINNLERKELERYEIEILHMETPDLYKILSSPSNDFKAEQLPADHFLAQIRSFGESPHWNADKLIN